MAREQLMQTPLIDTELERINGPISG